MKKSFLEILHNKQQEYKKQLANDIANYWYNELHCKYNPITQKQKLADYIKIKLNEILK